VAAARAIERLAHGAAQELERLPVHHDEIAEARLQTLDLGETIGRGAIRDHDQELAQIRPRGRENRVHGLDQGIGLVHDRQNDGSGLERIGAEIGRHCDRARS
jgi:hypothetical protein